LINSIRRISSNGGKTKHPKDMKVLSLIILYGMS